MRDIVSPCSVSLRTARFQFVRRVYPIPLENSRRSRPNLIREATINARMKYSYLNTPAEQTSSHTLFKLFFFFFLLDGGLTSDPRFYFKTPKVRGKPGDMPGGLHKHVYTLLSLHHQIHPWLIICFWGFLQND